MRIGTQGLGRMGANMARGLMTGGHACVVFDRNPQNVATLAAEDDVGCGSLDEPVRKLAKPRAWL